MKGAPRCCGLRRASRETQSIGVCIICSVNSRLLQSKADQRHGKDHVWKTWPRKQWKLTMSGLLKRSRKTVCYGIFRFVVVIPGALWKRVTRLRRHVRGCRVFPRNAATWQRLSRQHGNKRPDANRTPWRVPQPFAGATAPDRIGALILGALTPLLLPYFGLSGSATQRNERVIYPLIVTTGVNS